jgi:3-oxoacyl-[acyl-carrier-protein] synthase-3
LNTYSRIIGTGSYLPAQRVSNQDLVSRLAKNGIKTNDDWIVERTGIHQRHFANHHQNTSDLALEAAQKALLSSGYSPQDIDLIIVATSTPDKVLPSSATLLQQKLGITGCPAFDVQAACSGFIYAITIADAMIRAETAHCALVVGAEVFSRLLDFQDRTTCVLFGDGAGAVILKASDRPGILATTLHADGKYTHVLQVPGQINQGAIDGTPFLQMDGQAVFKLAVNALEKAAYKVLQQANKLATDIDWLIPHQANIRIMQSIAKKLGLPQEKLIATVHQHANTSAASVGLALDNAVQNNKIQPGDTLLLEGVGAGFTWGAVLLEF